MPPCALLLIGVVVHFGEKYVRCRERFWLNSWLFIRDYIKFTLDKKLVQSTNSINDSLTKCIQLQTRQNGLILQLQRYQWTCSPLNLTWVVRGIGFLLWDSRKYKPHPKRGRPYGCHPFIHHDWSAKCTALAYHTSRKLILLQF